MLLCLGCISAMQNSRLDYAVLHGGAQKTSLALIMRIVMSISYHALYKQHRVPQRTYNC